VRLPRSLFPQADDAPSRREPHWRAEMRAAFHALRQCRAVRFCGEACRPSAGSDSLVRLERHEEGALGRGRKARATDRSAWLLGAGSALDHRPADFNPLWPLDELLAHSPLQECPASPTPSSAAVPWLPDAAPARTDDGRLNLLPGDTCESSSWPASTDSVGASFWGQIRGVPRRLWVLQGRGATSR
jgi:hypothetical protein